MIIISIISRISNDKNWFIDIVRLADILEKKNFGDFEINFIGAIEDENIRTNIEALAQEMNLGSKIKFSGKSISLLQLNPYIQNGYFINFVIGDFLGYSSIECLKLGFKTFFYNVDPTITKSDVDDKNTSMNIDDLAFSLLELKTNKIETDEKIMSDNKSRLKNYELNDDEVKFLKGMILLGKNV